MTSPSTPLAARVPRRWPDDAGVWVCPVIVLDTHEDCVPEGWPQVQPRWADSLRGLGPDVDIARVGARDYGLRRGFFRLAGALKALRLPYALAVDVLTAETRPDLVQSCLQGGWGDGEWVAHGLSWSRPLHAAMDEAGERAYLRETRERLAACGIFTDTWLGIARAQSPRTPALLAQAGYRICLDGCDDEQPRPWDGSDSGSGLWSLPQMADLDDAHALCAPRGATPRAYARRIVEAAAVLAEEGRVQARVLAFTLRPFVTGQPFRVDALLDAFVQLSLLPGVRLATPTQIVEAWQKAAEG
jgi:allantoinase